MSLTQNYPRRAGAADSGRDYEVVMTALVSLRCAVQPQTRDMWVGSNIDQVGDFDDIVLYRIMPDGSGIAYLIQLKHQETPRNIARHDFKYNPHEKPAGGKRQKSKADFSLYKYSRGYTEFNTRLSNPAVKDEAEVIKLLRNATAIHYVLYTNKGVDDCEFIHCTDDHCNVHDLSLLLNTSETKPYAYTFDPNTLDDNSEFLQRLLLLTNQVHVSRAQHLLQSELQKLLKTSHSVKIDLKEAASNFLAFFHTWIKDKGPKTNQKDGKIQICYTLSKTDVIRKLIDVLLENYKLSFAKQAYVYHDDCARKQIWTEIVSNKAVTVIDGSEHVTDFLRRYVGHEIKRYCGEMNKNWTEKLKNKTQSKFYNRNKRLLIDMHKIVGSEGTVNLYDVYKCLWFTGELPMLLQIENEHEFNEIRNVLSILGRDLRLIIIKKNNNVLEGSDFSSLSDLSTLERAKILAQPVELQKRGRVRLGDLIDDSMHRHVTCRDIIDVLTDNFNIGHTYKPLIGHFVERSLIRTARDGSEEVVDVQSVLRDENDAQIHVVSAVPGMGKTVLLDSVVYCVPLDRWVLKINLNEHEAYYEDVKDKKVPAEAHLRYFNGTDSSALDGAVFSELLGRKRVVVLLDGLDEVSISDKEVVTEIASSLYCNGYRTWITTRPIMRTYLESEFGTIAYTLKPFSRDDQAVSLTKYFQSKHPSPKYDPMVAGRFVDELLTAASANLLDRDYEFTGVPLHTQLLAEVFADEYAKTLETGTVRFDPKFDLLYLYQAFVNKKTDILCRRFGRGAKDMRVFFEEHQQLFALKILFDETTLKELKVDQKLAEYYGDQQRRVHFLQREGIIVVGHNNDTGTSERHRFHVRFIHRTFAEFLAAQWLMTNFKSANEDVQTTIRFVLKKRWPPFKLHTFLFDVFDRMLAKDRPLHLKLIHGTANIENNNNVRTNEPITIKDFDYKLKDVADRSFLHLLAICYDDDDFERVVGELPQDTPVDRDAFGYNPLDYAMVNKSLRLGDVLCTIFPCLKIENELLLDLRYCLEFARECVARNYRSLLKVVVPYLVIEFLTMWYLEKQSQIEQLMSFLSEDDFFYGIHYAAAFGCESNVREALSSQDANQTDHHGNAPLHYATILGRTAIVRLLIEAGADVNQRGKHLYAPLHYGAETGRREVITVLLANGAEIDALNEYNRTPLYNAFDHNQMEAAELLASAGAKDNIKDKKGCTLIHHASKYGSTAVIEELLARGADVNKTNYHNETPLHLAFQSSHPDMIQLLLGNGAKLDKQNNAGEYPLHYAANTYDSKCLELILKTNNCDTEVKDDDGLTPLHFAIRKRQLDNARMLISYGADCSAMSTERNTVLHYAAMNGDAQFVREILDKKVDVNAVNDNGDTPLHFALVWNGLDIAEVLLERGARSVTNKTGTTTLHAACRCGNERILRDLLLDRSDVNKQNSNLNTPLHFAAEKGNVEVARFLLDNGAIVNVKNDAGRTPLHLSVYDQTSFGSKDFEPFKCTLELLLENGAAVNACDSKGNTALHYASKGRSRAFDIFLKENVEENNADFCRDVVLTLLSNGADVHLKNNDGKMAVDLANDTRIVSFLSN